MTGSQSLIAPRGEDQSDAPPSTVRRRRGWSRGVILLPIAVLAFVAHFVRLPYYVIGPGPARDVQPLIHIGQRPTFPSSGHLFLTTVNIRRANVYDLVDAWIDGLESVVPESRILPPGQTPQQEEEIQRSKMDTSKIDAAYVALSRFTAYPRRHRPGALVERVAKGTPADGKLFAGDVIVAVDGRTVEDPDDLGARIRASGEGTPLHLRVRTDGRTREVSVAPKRVEGYSRPIIGVSLIRDFPFPVTIESGDIGGPSAGLMWTLGLTELLTREDLAGGRRIAGTGEITLRGDVLPIGAVEEKVVAAERAGSSVFLAPAADAAAARSAASEIEVVPVRTFGDVVDYLRGDS